MKQYSNDGSHVELELLSGELLFIDPLYLQDINKSKVDVEQLQRKDNIAFIKAIEEKIFPFSGGMLLGFKRYEPADSVYQFDIRKLRYFNHQDKELERLSYGKKIIAFATDSGSFLIMDMVNFDKLLVCITYDELTDASLDRRLDEYIQNVNEQLGNKGWAYIEAPGVGSDYIFKGSGSFILIE